MAKNPVLFPDTFADNRSRLAVGRFGDEGATTAWVKQMIVEMFYGRGVPLFSFGEDYVSWGDGFAYFDNVAYPIAEGSYSFGAIDTNWYYVCAQSGAETTVVVSGSPPINDSQQLWWNLRVEDGKIIDVIPAKPGFGV